MPPETSDAVVPPEAAQEASAPHPDATSGPVVISIIGSKGGAGKTTICAALASAMVFSQKRVLLIDADAQQSLYDWALRAQDKGNSSDLVLAVKVRDEEELDAVLDDAFDNNRADYILIDTAGIAGAWADIVAASSSLIITPVILTENNVLGAIKTFAWYQGLRARVDNPDDLARHITLLTRYEKTLGPKEQALYDRVRAELDLFDYAMRDRKAYRHMESDGLLGAIALRLKTSEVAIDRGQANHYIEALREVAHIFNQMLIAADQKV
ncbi:MAG: ParA family protein [Roseinatronobacter sp.]